MADARSVVRSQRRKKQQAVDYLGGCCVICGYNKCLAALEFHHTDPTVKEHKLTYIVCRWTWKRVLEELRKCILVCSNCHREIHFGLHDVEQIHRQFASIIERECDCCGAPYRTRNESQRFCSARCRQIGLRKVERPTRETLAQDMAALNWTDIGRKYGVTNTAVKKWARRYNLV